MNIPFLVQTTNIQISFFIPKFAAKIIEMLGSDWKDQLMSAFPEVAELSKQAEDQSQEEVKQEETLAPSKQKLIVAIDRRNRGGKQVTLVKGFVGREDEFEALSKKLKKHCGVGGNYTEDEIMIQGDKRDAVLNFLLSLGYKAKRGN